MGVQKSKLKQISSEEKDNYDEEPDYVIKTRSPYPQNWRLNIMVSKREEDLKNEAFQLARLKCHKKVKSFMDCEQRKIYQWKRMGCFGLFSNAQRNPNKYNSEKDLMNQCFQFESEVEMDKRRRDITRNNEWWWRDLYDQDGEIGYFEIFKGKQASYKDESWFQKVYQDFWKKLV